MKKYIFFVLAILSIFPFAAKAQHIVDGIPHDSIIIRFTNPSIQGFIPDTAAIPLWQIGRTHKSFFTTDTTSISMMTDSLHSYPAHANNWFVIKIPKNFNTIIDFWHKYQTDSTHAGGIVEFSSDHGVIWQNIKGACNTDSFFLTTGILTQNFYTFNDTLLTGEPSFTGTSNVQQYSRLQFFEGLPVRTTGHAGCRWSIDTFYVRFRFTSDTATDTLAGWVIDSIKIERDLYEGSVARISKGSTLQAFPNPSYDGIFVFPALTNEEQFIIEVYNAMGGRILKTPYSRSLNLNNYARGLYFYKVSDGTEYYSGRLLTE